jgi:hypothetical protein
MNEELKQRYAAALHRSIDNTLGTEQSNDEPVAWKAYEEVHFSDQYIMRWVREGDEYVNRISKEMMEEFKSLAEKKLTVTLDDCVEAELEQDVGYGGDLDMLEFARAILRKAQEK